MVKKQDSKPQRKQETQATYYDRPKLMELSTKVSRRPVAGAAKGITSC